MLKHGFTLFTLLLLAFGAGAQKRDNIYIRVGINAGGSILFHNTHFRPALEEVYQFVKISHDPDPYEWSEFEQDYQLRSTYAQPRYGFNIFVTHKVYPVFLNFEMMSSPSSYQKMLFAFTLGLGKDLHPVDMDMFFSGHVGFKRVFRDAGFGAETLTYSIGKKDAREAFATFYNPSKPLGAQSGNLLSVRLGCGHVLGSSERAAAGVELVYELDITNETVRQARMTNLGFNIYFRFDLGNTSF